MTYTGDILASAKYLQAELSGITDLSQETAHRRQELVKTARDLVAKCASAVSSLSSDLLAVKPVPSGTNPIVAAAAIAKARDIIQEMGRLSEIQGFAGRALRNLEAA
jgi:hypothetical protein